MADKDFQAPYMQAVASAKTKDKMEMIRQKFISGMKGLETSTSFSMLDAENDIKKIQKEILTRDSNDITSGQVSGLYDGDPVINPIIGLVNNHRHTILLMNEQLKLACELLKEAIES